jgi:Fe-S cluster assembly scaffold protein SufB
MSDVKLLGVYSADVDALQSKMATLWEELELSERNRIAAERRYEEQVEARNAIAAEYGKLTYCAGICKDSLAAAEQRNANQCETIKAYKDVNAELERGLRIFAVMAAKSTISAVRLIAKQTLNRAHALKPTESGASE